MIVESHSISTSNVKLLRWPVIPRVVAEPMQRLDSATTLRYAQNDDGYYCCRLEVKIESDHF